MATGTEYSDSFKARGLTDAQAKAAGAECATRDQAQLDLEAEIAASKAVKQLEHDRCLAMRNVPGQPSKGPPFWNETTKRWERK